MKSIEWVCGCGGQGLCDGWLSFDPREIGYHWIKVNCSKCGKEVGDFNPYQDDGFVPEIHDRRKEKTR